MVFTDTHTHLYDNEFDNDRKEVVERAILAGVKRMFIPNTDFSTIRGLFEVCDIFPDNCFPMLGLHPCSVKENFENELLLIEKKLKNRKVIAIGEIGLDYYWDISFKKEQEIALHKQIEWALKFNLPVVIHSRNSFKDVCQILDQYKNQDLKGVFHCFSGSEEDIQKALALNFYMGIGGVVTFKNGGLDKILPQIPLEKIILETDSPYLAPVPHRGKRNESSYIRIIADRVAEIKNVSVELLAQITTENSKNLFGI